ncbi:MAG: ATP-binding protein [Treponema sp.]|nr:ATP-binding protein [Treponema sp.]
MNKFEQDKISTKENKSRMKTWMFNSILLYCSYCGVTLIQTLFLGSAVPLHIAIIPPLAGLPMVMAVVFVYFKMPYSQIAPGVIAIVTQLCFFAASAQMKRLDFYFIMMLLILCIVMHLKRFKALAVTTSIIIVINIAAIFFLIPHWEWLNLHQFYGQFLLFLFGSVLILIITYSVEQKENRAERAFMAFSSLLDTTPNYMVITDSLNRVRYISEPMAQFAYFSSQELAVGKPLLDLFSDKKLKLMFADILNADSFVETVMTIEMNGEEHHFKVVTDKLAGDVDGLFIDISDITATINSKKIAEEAQARAEAASDSKSKFLANMSHEIRTPMNAIIGISQIVLQKENLPKEYAVALEKIHNSGNSLLGIINDILDLSKIETGKLELVPVVYDMPSLINDTVQINIVRIGSKQINFIIDADRNLPSKLYGDELRIKQILNNLLSNAIKYTEKGHVKMSVSHSAEDRDVMLHITIEDTGQGMKAEDQEMLFSEYQRFNVDANRSTEGTGLGLSIVKKLVEMMNGTINVQSEYGAGSTFTVTVRQKAVPCEEIGDQVSKNLQNFTFMEERQDLKLQIVRDPMPYGKVLVVDDVETNLFVAQGLLAPYKLAIETANSGFEAIDLIENGKTYDIIFMDHMMPRMDGIETTKKLRSLGYNGIIVALTANALTSSARMFYQNGFDRFIPKPIDIQDLNSALNEYIRDKYPEEAKKYKANAVEAAVKPEGNRKLLEIFRRDAEKAIITLRETAASGDIKLFTTTAHAMKSALANVGESEMSKIALTLESAGQNGDTEFIDANTESFVKSLETMIENITPAETLTDTDAGTDEDMPYLAEQLRIIESACESYDDTEAYAALDRLKEKKWKMQTTDALEKIRDMLFLHSDFDGAAEYAAALLERHQTSGANTNDSTQSELWRSIEQITGLSVQTGLDRLGGRRDFYEKSLKASIEEIENSDTGLRGFLASGDMQNFSIMVHGMKGLLTNIGAMGLYSQARDLETAADQADTAFCAANLPPFLEELRGLGSSLAEAFANHAPFQGPLEIPPELSLALAPVLKKLTAAFDNTDFAAIDEGMKSLSVIKADGALQEEIEKIKDAVLTMDHSGAMEVIRKLSK